MLKSRPYKATASQPAEPLNKQYDFSGNVEMLVRRSYTENPQ